MTTTKTYYVIKHIETGLYLTDYHIGKGVLTNPKKNWTADIDDAMNYTNKPFITLGSFHLIGKAEVIEITD